jgi:hypothetical protein
LCYQHRLTDCYRDFLEKNSGAAQSQTFT